MNNEIKETNLILRKRNYNGDYGIGSVFTEEFKLNVKQLVDNSSNQDGLVVFTANTGFCCDLNLGANQLANIKTEIPFLVKCDKLNTFNEIANRIKTNQDYKYNESHYANDRFDPKRLEYFDIIIDGEEFESNDAAVFNALLHDVINVEEITELMDDYYQKLTSVMRKMNQPVNQSDTTDNNENSRTITDVAIENAVNQNLDDEDQKRLIGKLIKKIDVLPVNIETTIAELMQLDNTGVAMVEPMIQGTIFNELMKVCETLNFKIEVNRNEIGGLGYHYKFKKINVEPQNNYSQEELKEMFYKIMSEEEVQKVDDLGMNQEISKLNTSTFQIKYFNGIGYVFIGNGYLMMTDGTEKQQFFCTVCKDEESAKQEILKRLK